MQVTKQNGAAGNFEFLVDGHAPNAYVKSVEGGWGHGQLGSSGKNPHEFPQLTTVTIDPIIVEFGLMGAPDMLKWIQKSWRAKEPQTRNGQISYADFDMRTTLEHEFRDAVITDTTFPTLDGASKDGGYLKCTLQPEDTTIKICGAPGARISGTTSPLQKMWTPSAFRLNIDGIDGMEYTNKIDQFSVKMTHTRPKFGVDRLPETVPCSIQFPRITGTISSRYGDNLIKWHQHYVRSKDGPGTKDGKAQKSGALEFLTPDRKKTLFTIRLEEVAPLHVCVAPSKANDENIRRLKFEFYVRRMELEGSADLGFF